ncbi:PEP-CTERM sorting domain-containing protein [Rugamonas sp. FT82W]|uniref:PEP-CTERM sorting domain-containing protein n=1 Tax=Duganella vulcania TaxID=2692166 RepID=A0A845G9I6_9BURK|nr:PEP-CTERM sorting domain-containing protein [Duganella vulcania]MYM91333.1 PEP-CTERM sorting domain-containing protein [Duganella vulcania]
MPTLSRLTKPLLASALLTCCFSASASVPSGSGTTAFTHLKLGVIDLTPNDGQAAHYTLAATDTDLNGATVGTGADGILDALTAKSGVNASWPPQQNTSYGSLSYHVTLSAHSALTLSGHLLTSDIRVGKVPDPAYQIYGYAQANVYISPSDGPAYPPPLLHQNSSVWAWGGGTEDHRERDFMVALANTSDSDQDLIVKVAGYVSYDYTQPVPEPQTYAMLLAGLMVAPLLRRRHARRQRQNAA